MKLHEFVGAPNPKKVRVYLAEKGISVPSQPVNLMTGENRQPEFLKKNPMGGLPVLELDDGTFLPESLAIIEYFEDMHPNPPMIGTTPIERARVRALERLIELSVLGRVAVIFQNTSPLFAGRIKQNAEAAENARGQLATTLGILDAKIGGNKFAAGDKPSIADCTLCATMQFAEFAQIPIGPEHKNLHRWYEAFKQRPSASA